MRGLLHSCRCVVCVVVVLLRCSDVIMAVWLGDDLSQLASE
jgi:hypothetical protein